MKQKIELTQTELTTSTRERVERYANAIDAIDVEAFVSCFNDSAHDCLRVACDMFARYERENALFSN